MAVLTEFERDQIATKADFYAIETRLVKWTVGILIAVVLATASPGALVVLIRRLSDRITPKN